MSVDLSLPNSITCKIILPNACWIEMQNDTKDSVLLVSVPCDESSSIIVIDNNGKRNELCFVTGSVIKIENNVVFYNKNRLEDCENSDHLND